MKTFYQSFAAHQSLLLLFYFLSAVFCLFMLIIVIGNHRDRKKLLLNVPLLTILFALLVIMADIFAQSGNDSAQNVWFQVPVLLLWCIAAAADILLICQLVRVYRAKGKTLNRNSVKEAMDRLPIGICYFNLSGSVKLCNLQMCRIFRTLAQRDLQRYSELNEALEGCGPDTGVICLSKELQNYLFPDGRVWRYSQTEVTSDDGNTYIEAVFSDLTQQYNQEQELKKQTKELERISVELKRLSDNALILTREKEVLSAKTKLHDQMGAGLTAIRQILLQRGAAETENAVELLRRAVNAVKNDNEYPPEKDELAKFRQDADTVGVRLNISGQLPGRGELRFVLLLAMRECLSNGVRHAGAKELCVTITEDEGWISACITNDGTPPTGDIVPKGGLLNLYRCVLDCGGKMKICSKPRFVLTVTLPKTEEDKV
ncbi:MAG: ATP-binding protein [Firmicutes bacterium]|nr:ATP-binding protein [Bacillota bacterium]